MRRSFTIGVILDELLGYGLAHPLFSMIIQTFREAVEEKGFSMVMIASKVGNSNIESYISHCNQLNVDGVFILCTESQDAGIQALIHSDIPTVLFDTPGQGTSCVTSDHYQGAFDAVNFLVAKGHQRIGHIYGSQLTYAGRERQRGFLDAMQAQGLTPREEYQVSGGYFDLKYGKIAMKELVSLETPPTAVFASGDMMALGAIQTCVEENIQVPEDISIIGFDNLLILEWMKPSLTTVAQDYEAIGQECCDLLSEAIANKSSEIIVKSIGTRIIERDSCAKI